MRTHSLRAWFALGLALSITATGAAEPRRVALLVGVSQYAGGANRLDGPSHDVAAMRSVLQRRWGFAAGDVRSLVDQQATRANILQALRDLQQRSGAGDEVLIYLSGHGYSALSGDDGPPVPYGSGAFVPYDYDEGAEQPEAGLIVGRSDLRPLISALESGGRRLWAVSDSCFSGQAVRAMRASGAAQLPERLMPPPRRQVMNAAPNPASPAAAPGPYPYRQTGYLSAAAEGETAKDISSRHLAAFPTLDGKPHGAFTDALLRVLEGQWPADYNRDGLLSLNEVHRAVSDFMAQRAYGHSAQRLPAVAEDAQSLGARPVLTIPGAAAKPLDKPPSLLRVQADGLPPALLQRIRGIPETEFVSGSAAFDLALLADATALAFVTAAGDTVATLPLADNQRIVGQLRQRAWAQRLDQLSQRHRRAVLAADIAPVDKGGNVKIGTEVVFTVLPDRAATLLLVNINAEGQVSVLYPYFPNERYSLPGLRAHEIQRIKVEAPTGMDDQLIWAFDEPPAGLDVLTGLKSVDADNRRLAGLERLITRSVGKFSYVRTELRTYDK